MKSQILCLIVIGSTFITGTSQFDVSRMIKCGLSNLFYIPLRGPHSTVNYNLYTQENPKVPCDLQPTGDAIKKCKFNPKLDTKVLVHGWVSKLTSESMFNRIKDKILKVDNVNVVIFNWTAYTDNLDTSISVTVAYLKAVGASFYTGLLISSWLRFLQIHTGIDPSKFHFIAHSLGAEVSSYAGKTTCTIGKITFLEASGEKIRHLPEFLQPSYTDAKFVDAMHTDGSAVDGDGYGFLRPIGNIDYYPNGGSRQPQCKGGSPYTDTEGDVMIVNSTTNEKGCNHDASLDYYLESINEDCKFIGQICNNYEEFKIGNCSSEYPACRMGYYTNDLLNVPPHSKCYLKTSPNSPYCLGKNPQ